MRKLLVMLFVATAAFAGAARGQLCPGAAPYVFTDVLAGDPFCSSITWLAQKGVTLGCQAIDANNRLFCPADGVRRDQMAAFMSRLSDALFPATCLAGQVIKWNGLAWACSDDNIGGGGGGGTVTSVAASTGLTAAPNPITGAGTISVAPSYRLPQACAASQVPKWIGGAWTCANDVDTNAGGTVTSLSGGSGITLAPNPIVGVGTISADTAYLQRRVFQSCIAGASIRAIAADGSVTCEVDSATNAFVRNGNAFGGEAVIGTTDAFALDVRVNDSRVMRYEPNSISPNVIGGSPANSVTAGVRGATIAGGGVPVGDTDPNFLVEAPNRVTDAYGTVGGGYANRAGNDAGTTTDHAYATVGGGLLNTAGAHGSTVGGGWQNTASGDTSTVGGGSTNAASGAYSTVGGGWQNTAGGDYSVAMGRQAKANHKGTFVWADSSPVDFGSVANNTFRARATGGFRFVTAVDQLTGAYSESFYIGPSGNVESSGEITAVAFNLSSDAAAKTGFAGVDPQQILRQVAALPVHKWSYKRDKSSARHIGPTAQDFHAAFGVGSGDTTIATIDADGVALAAIQGLNAKLEAKVAAKDAEIASLKREMADHRATHQKELADLRLAVEVLMARTSTEGRVAQTR